MILKSLNGYGKVEINKGDKLTPDQLSVLKWASLSPEIYGIIDKKQLTAKQKKDFINFAMSEAEKYSTTHPMRYTILSNCIKAIM